MTPQTDPYRVLGLPPGASLNEIRSAYRRLAKLYHPDAAGERALPRFLAIQAAYERLVDGEGHLRTPGRAGAGPGREPWRADAARSRASRDAWRARRAAAGGGAGSEGDPAAGGRSRGRPSAAGGSPGGPPDGAPQGSRPRADRPPSEGTAGDGASGRQRRTTRKARPGSTTYDEAAGMPRDPSWEGGAWYGPSSGTYWTINPREYADPRKHGPEYQARARRAKGAPAMPDSGPADPAGTPTEPRDPGPTPADPATRADVAPGTPMDAPAPVDRGSDGRLRSLARRIARTPRA